MALLKIVSGDLAGSSIPIGAGSFRVGRADGNDLCLRDASISSSHCEIAIDASGHLLVRDLGSTNGTFIEGQKVQQALVVSGQRLRLGNLEMIFDSEVAVAAPASLEPVSLQMPPPPNPAAMRVTPVFVPPAPPAVAPGGDECANHAGIAAAVKCSRCGKTLCLQCTKQQKLGMSLVEFCLGCGGQCKSLKEVAKETAKAASIPKTFGEAVKGAFKYPLRGNGIVLLVIGTIIYAAMDAFLQSRTGFLNFYNLIAKLIAFVLGYGYLFAYMQRIVTSSATGEDEPPDWPEISDLGSDVYRPFFQLMFTMLIAYLPSFFVAEYLGELPRQFTSLLGDIYFPMALLAVAMSDSYTGLNPIFVMSSIMKIPKQYFLTCLLFIGLEFLWTHVRQVVQEIPIFMVPLMIYWFAYLFFLLVAMRVLGLLYLLNRKKLGWGL